MIGRIFYDAAKLENNLAKMIEDVYGTKIQSIDIQLIKNILLKYGRLFVMRHDVDHNWDANEIYEFSHKDTHKMTDIIRYIMYDLIYLLKDKWDKDYNDMMARRLMLVFESSPHAFMEDINYMMEFDVDQPGEQVEFV